MSVSLNASLTAGAVISSDTSGSLALQTAGTSAVTINSSQVVTVVNDATIHGLTVGQGGGSVSTNTAVGASALTSNSSGANNTAVGYQAGYSNTTSGYSVYIGQNAGYNITGGANTFIGSSYAGGSGYLVTSGAYNTILGGYTGNQGGLDIRTSSNYIVLSDGAGNPRGYFDGNGKLTNPQGLGSFSQGNTYSLGTGSIAWSSIPDGVSIFSGSFTTVGTFQNIITGLDNGSSYMLAMGKIGQTDLSSGSFCTFVNSTNLSFMGGTSSSIVQMSSNNFQMKCNSSSYGNNYVLTVIKGG